MSVEVAPRITDWETPDLVRGTRVFIQSMPAPLSGRLGVIEDYDSTMHAYVVHVEGGNPRQIYRENLRIAPFDEVTGEQVGFPPAPVKKTRRTNTRTKREDAGTNDNADNANTAERSLIQAGDQLLLCIESDQFTLTELQGMRRLTKHEPHVFALSLGIDDAEVPRWIRKAQGRGNTTRKSSAAFKSGESVYAQFTDGKFYPAKIKTDLRDKFLVEWVGGVEDDQQRPVKKSLVCKRTVFNQLKTKPSFLGALAVASGAEKSTTKRTGRPPKNATSEDEEAESADERSDLVSVDDEEEEGGLGDYASSSSSAELDWGGVGGMGLGISRSIWKSQILPVVRLLRTAGIKGFVDVQRKETFLFPGMKGESAESENVKDLEESFLDWLSEAVRMSKSIESRGIDETISESKEIEGFRWAAEIPFHEKDILDKRRLEEVVDKLPEGFKVRKIQH